MSERDSISVGFSVETDDKIPAGWVRVDTSTTRAFFHLDTGRMVQFSVAHDGTLIMNRRDSIWEDAK